MKSIKIIIALVAFSLSTSAFAAEPPVINKVFNIGGQLSIEGSGFDRGVTPAVELGSNALAVTAYSDTQIIALLPSIITNGDFLLLVDNSKKSVTYDLTLGATGGPPPAIDNIAFVAKTLGNYDNPVAALNDFDSWCKSPTEQEPCKLIIGPGLFQVSEPLITKNFVNIVGSGEGASSLERINPDGPDCSISDSLISHPGGSSTISQLSLFADFSGCDSDGMYIIEQLGGRLTLLEVIIKPSVRRGLGDPRGLLGVSGGGAFVVRSNLTGNVLLSAGLLNMRDSKIAGGEVESGPTLRILESSIAEISDTYFSGPDNATLISNAGRLRVHDSEFVLDFASDAVDNSISGHATITGSIFRTANEEVIPVDAIINSGVLEVSNSLIEGNVVDGGKSIELFNDGSKFVISNSVVKDVNIFDGPGTLRCVFVSDGIAAERGANCMTAP